MTKEMF